ncbi:MAG: signal peptidase I [Candidatus Binatia bacterium]
MTESISGTGRTRTKDDRVFFDWRYVRGLEERRRHYRLAFILFWSILIGYSVKGYVVSAGITNDKSMHPTLVMEGYYLVNRYIYYFVNPERGDIVVFRRTTDASVEDAKRIVGLPGETLLIKSGDVYIDGRRLDEPYAVGKTYPDHGPYFIAERTYYVLGDNRWVREDSRDFGAVPLKNIEGKIAPDTLFSFR